MTTVSLQNVIHPSTLYEAWEKVRTNKGVGGVDHVSLDDFEADLDKNIETLINEVTYETYRPLPLLRVDIDKSDGGKRPLSIPTIRDRVLQTAITLVLTPVFELEFEEISFAYRKGRSVNQAVSLIERLRDKGYKWVVDADIHRYFDEVNHNLLMQEVEKLVTDKGILHLIRQWLNATVVDRNQRYKLTKGIPQGSPLSPLLANLFLDQLDDTLLDKNYRLVRYADDFVILCKSADKAQDALEITADILEGLRLGFSKRKTSVVNFDEGFHFLGVQFIRTLAIKSKPQIAEKFQQSKQETATPIAQKIARLQKLHKKRSKIKITFEKPKQWYSYALPAGTRYTSSEEMREAFAEAGIIAKQFPSESQTVENIAPPEQLEEQSCNKETTDSSEPRLKTLYLMEHGSTLGKEYERFIIKKKGMIIKQIPAIHIDQIMVFGNSQLTTQVMQFCLQERIPIYLLSGKGKYYGMVDSFSTEPVLLHREQFLRADDKAFCLQLAKQFIKGKITNSHLLLKRLTRNRTAPAFEQAVKQLKYSQEKIETASTLDQLRGYEGTAARINFQAIAATVDEKWRFTGRVKQPPTDPINAMLSYGYTLLFYNIYTLLRTRGLNPHVGYLHPMRMGHPALASDLMEEFRSIVVDAVVLNIVLNNKLSPEDFETLEETAGNLSAEKQPCLLTPKARGIFIRYLEKKLNANLTHPISKLKLDYRRCMEHQVNHLAAVIRGKETHYQPLILT